MTLTRQGILQRLHEIREERITLHGEQLSASGGGYHWSAPFQDLDDEEHELRQSLQRLTTNQPTGDDDDLP